MVCLKISDAVPSPVKQPTRLNPRLYSRCRYPVLFSCSAHKLSGFSSTPKLHTGNFWTVPSERRRRLRAATLSLLVISNSLPITSWSLTQPSLLAQPGTPEYCHSASESMERPFLGSRRLDTRSARSSVGDSASYMNSSCVASKSHSASTHKSSYTTTRGYKSSVKAHKLSASSSRYQSSASRTHRCSGRRRRHNHRSSHYSMRSQNSHHRKLRKRKVSRKVGADLLKVLSISMPSSAVRTKASLQVSKSAVLLPREVQYNDVKQRSTDRYNRYAYSASEPWFRQWPSAMPMYSTPYFTPYSYNGGHGCASSYDSTGPMYNDYMVGWRRFPNSVPLYRPSKCTTSESQSASDQRHTLSKSLCTGKVSPQVSTEVSSQVSSETSPQVSTEVSSQVSSEASPQVSTEVLSQVSSEASPQVSTEVSPQLPTVVSPQPLMQASPQVSTEVSYQLSNVVPPQASTLQREPFASEAHAIMDNFSPTSYFASTSLLKGVASSNLGSFNSLLPRRAVSEQVLSTATENRGQRLVAAREKGLLDSVTSRSSVSLANFCASCTASQNTGNNLVRSASLEMGPRPTVAGKYQDHDTIVPPTRPPRKRRQKRHYSHSANSSSCETIVKNSSVTSRSSSSNDVTFSASSDPCPPVKPVVQYDDLPDIIANSMRKCLHRVIPLDSLRNDPDCNGLIDSNHFLVLSRFKEKPGSILFSSFKNRNDARVFAAWSSVHDGSLNGPSERLDAVTPQPQNMAHSGDLPMAGTHDQEVLASFRHYLVRQFLHLAQTKKPLTNA